MAGRADEIYPAWQGAVYGAWIPENSQRLDLFRAIAVRLGLLTVSLNAKGDIMKHLRVVVMACTLVLLIGPAPAGALPDFTLSVYWTEYAGPEMLSIMAVPDGNGDAFDQAILPGGTRTNGLIMVALLDPMGVPIPGYPYEDIWLAASEGGLSFCALGNNAAANTDANGETWFRDPLRGGGASEGLLQVVVSGMALVSSPGVRILVNSPDLNGDLEVGVIDVSIFAGDFYGAYRYRSDFDFNGQIGLTDVTRLARSMGAICP